MSALEKSAGPASLPEINEPEEVRRPLLSSIHDVPIRVTAVLGKTRMKVADLMALESGAVIELDRRVGEPIDLYVNDTLVARGELVMVDGVLGVTMTEVVKQTDL